MSKLAKIQSKIVSLEEAKKLANSWKSQNQKVVFTNGCFDILHLGHVTYLAKAADLGDKLIVALNTDASVKQLEKGDDRPINPEHARLHVLASLECIDAVLLFDHHTPLDEIITIQPSILVKGADYDPDERDMFSKSTLWDQKEVIAFGGEVKVIDLVDGFSTTSILAKGKN